MAQFFDFLLDLLHFDASDCRVLLLADDKLFVLTGLEVFELIVVVIVLGTVLMMMCMSSSFMGRICGEVDNGELMLTVDMAIVSKFELPLQSASKKNCYIKLVNRFL